MLVARRPNHGIVALVSLLEILGPFQEDPYPGRSEELRAHDEGWVGAGDEMLDLQQSSAQVDFESEWVRSSVVMVVDACNSRHHSIQVIHAVWEWF